MSTLPFTPYVNGYGEANGRTPFTSVPPIVSIQQNLKVPNLKRDIVEGLGSEPKFLPGVLLWDTCGLKLFDEITQSPDYYPNDSEIDILSLHADDIVENIVPGSVVVELGSGNLRKTTILLKAIARQKKQVSYYALDLSKSELDRSLLQLARALGSSPYIRCHGLLGSYDDAALWIQKNHGMTSRPLYYLWMGNSIANYPPQAAISLLTRLGNVSLSTRNPRPSFIIAVDGCRDVHTIDRAYNIKEGQSRNFILNGLKHVNALAKQEVFRDADWGFKGMYDDVDRCYQSFYVAQKDVVVPFAGKNFHVAQGETIHAINSWKWDVEQVKLICGDADLKCSKTWQHSQLGYGVYLLEPQ
ncbi:MAG: hypothetical protein LQ351_002433 [Letrouitia transgressa]|nr:MAG: hypothetical protein LQ351_002433 [Letrouitia transgressa]